MNRCPTARARLFRGILGSAFGALLAGAPPCLGAAPIRFEPDFGVPGLWLSLRGRDAGDPKLQVEIDGQPCVVQAALPNAPARAGVVYAQVPQTAHSGPVTAHGPGEAPRKLGDLVVTPVVTGRFAPPAGLNAAAYHIVSPFGTSAVAADGSFKIPVLENGPTWIWAVSADPATALETLSTGAAAAPVISSLSTAASLVLMHPYLLSTQPDKAAMFWNAAMASPAVAALAARIDARASPDLLATDEGTDAVRGAAEAVIAGLPAPAAASRGGARLLSAVPGELRGQSLLGLDAKYVAARTKGDTLPVPRLELGNCSTLSRSNLLVEVKEVDVKSTRVRGSPVRDWIEQEVHLAPTFDNATKQSTGTLLLPFTTFSSSVDVVGSALNKLGGLIFSQAKYIAIPADHPGIYIIRAYGGMGALPGIDFKTDRQLIAGIPGGNQKLAVAVVSDALDALLNLLSLIPFNDGGGAKLQRYINPNAPISAGVAVIADPARLKPELILAAADLSVGLAEELANSSQGGSVDLQRIWDLITTVASNTVQRIITNRLNHAELGAKGQFELNAYKSWAFGDEVGEADRSAKVAAARAAEGRIGDLKKLWGKIGLLKKAALVGSIAERILGLIGAEPLETAVLFVNRPLTPQVARVDPPQARPGDTVFLGGDYLGPATFKARVEFRKLGAATGIDVGDVLVPTAGDGKDDLGTQVIKVVVPAGATGKGVFHVTTDSGEVDSPPFTVASQPSIDDVLPLAAEPNQNERITVLGHGFYDPVVVTVGQSTVPVFVFPRHTDTRLDFALPSTVAPGDNYVYVKSGKYDAIRSPSRLHVFMLPEGVPHYDSYLGVTVNSRAQSGGGGDRAITLADALGLATGGKALGSLAMRPHNHDPMTGQDIGPADLSCSPYAAELSRASPTNAINPASLSTTVGFSTAGNYCRPVTPDCPNCYQYRDNPPDAEKAPLMLSGDLEVPANVSLSLTNPISNAPAVLQGGRLLLTHDNASVGSIVLDGSTVVISGKNVHLGQIVVKNPPAVPSLGTVSIGAVAFLQGADGCQIDSLTVTNAAGDAVTFTDAIRNRIGKLAITNPGGRGIVFQDGADHNMVSGATVQGASGHGLFFGAGADGNLVTIAEVSGGGSDGIRFENTTANEVLPGGPATGAGYVFANKGAGVAIVGGQASDNIVGSLVFGATSKGGDFSTGNAVGVDVRDGAHHNAIDPMQVVNSQGAGISLSGLGTSGNLVGAATGTHGIASFGVTAQISGNGGDGVVVRDGASSNEIGGVQVSGQTFGLHITGGTMNQVWGSVFYGNSTGVCLDGKATLNVLYGDEIWGNRGPGLEIRDPGTSYNGFNGLFIGVPSGNLSPPGVPVTGNGGDGALIHLGASANVLGWTPALPFPDSDLQAGSIGNNGGSGVCIAGAGVDGNRVSGYSIGVGPYSNSPIVPNAMAGVLVTGGAQNNVLGGGVGDLVIAGNAGAGVVFTGTGTSGNQVASGEIGYVPGAKTPVGGNAAGIVVADGASDNVLGQYTGPGIQASEGFLSLLGVSGNSGEGIHIDAPGTSILFARVGTVEGSKPLPNATGILLGPNAAQGEIRGSIISGNKGDGIRLDGASNNWIDGSFIGLDSQGGQAVPNANGIHLVNGAQGNVIGSLNATTFAPNLYPFSNLISGNSGDGILIDGQATTGNLVRDDYFGIGLQLKPAPNARGVHIRDSPGNVIGSDEDLPPLDDTTGLSGIDMSLPGRNINQIAGNTDVNVLIEGAQAIDDVVGNNVIGRIGAKSRVGVDVTGGASGVRIGGGFLGDTGTFHEFPNGFYFNSDESIRIEGAQPSGSTALSNLMIGNGGSGIARLDGGLETTPVILTALGQAAFQATVPDDWASSSLLQLYSIGATETTDLQSGKTYGDVDLVASQPVDGPGTISVALPDDYFFNHLTTASFAATLTDPATGITSPFSTAVTVPPTPPNPSVLQLAVPPGLKDLAVQPGQAGVAALALDYKAIGAVRLGSLRLSASGSGNDAAAVARVSIGFAAPNSFDLDPNRPLLADVPGFARDDGVLELSGLNLDLPDGGAGRLLAFYDFKPNSPAGVYRLSAVDGSAVTAYTLATLQPAAAAGVFPLSGPALTVGAAAGAGDLNGDGMVNVADAVLLLQAAVGKLTLTAQQKAAADLNGDGKVDVRDAVLLLRKAVGIAGG